MALTLCIVAGRYSELEGGGWCEVAIPVTSLGEGNSYHAPYIVYCCRRVAVS